VKLLGVRALVTELKERRFAQFLTVYFAAAWGVLEVIDQLSQNEIFPPLVYRVALTLVLCGTPGILIVTWFHGQKGDQHMPKLEKVLISMVALFALTASGFVVRSGLSPEEANARGVALEPWADPTRVAVLYFDHRPAGDGPAADIALGLTEALIDQLSAVDTLHVLSRNASEMVRDTPMPEDSIARQLGVGTLVGGQVAIADDQVRVTISMIQGATGKQVGTRTIDSPRANLFALQDSISAQVAIFLREAIGQEVSRVEAQSGTDNVEAWELVQRAERTALGAQQLAAQGELHGAADQFAEADAVLGQAEALDPEWTLPITRRGWYAYRHARAYGLDPQPQIALTEQALGHAERALAIDSVQAEGLELRGTVSYWRALLNIAGHDQQHAVVDAAEDDLKKATTYSRRPASAYASLSHLLLSNGDVAGAKVAAQRSYEEDPFLANANLTLWRLSSTSWDMGSTTEAEKWCMEGFRRFADDFRFRQCQLQLFGLRDYPPDVPKAWALMQQFVEHAPPPLRPLAEKQGLMYMAMALVRANLPDSAKAVAVRGRAGLDVDPLQETTYQEAIARIWLATEYQERGQQAEADGQWEEVVRLMGVVFAANPAVLEGFRNDAENRSADKWFLGELVNQQAFRTLVGVR
jgi:TolB-like protein